MKRSNPTKQKKTAKNKGAGTGKLKRAKETVKKSRTRVSKKEIFELISPPKGMKEILPNEMPLLNKVVDTLVGVARFYGFSKIETPILEKAELFIRSVGKQTDIVEKEMFTLTTKGGTKLVLRPELTAPIVRSYIQNGMHKLPQPQKLYYLGPLFRHDRPQAGRYRQFHQIGLEIIGGNNDPVYDAQLIRIFYRMLEDLKIKELIVHINSIGCKACRSDYRTKLINYYKYKDVCGDCKRRIKQNPLRLLDCKKDICQPSKEGIPSILDSLCNPCKNHLKQVLEYLEEVNVPYILDSLLVRGLDYYSKTVFEIFCEGNKLALAGGGRYDYLAEMLGGRATPAVGAAMGIERVINLIEELDIKLPIKKDKAKVSLIYVGDLAKKKVLPVMDELRKSNVSVSIALGKKSLSGQLELANKEGVSLALILGQKEVYEESIIIRDMKSGIQESVPITKVVEEVKKRL